MIKKEAGIKEFSQAGEGLHKDYITLKELEELKLSNTPPVVIDLRRASKSDQRVRDSINISMQDLVVENVEELVPKKSTPIVLVCAQSFQITRMVALTTYAYPTLKLMGYTSVKVLQDQAGFKE